MASLYKNRNTWHLSVSFKGKRINRSLGTKDKIVAKQLKPLVESQIIAELVGIVQAKKEMPFEELVVAFLNAPHDWKQTTYQMNKMILEKHLNGDPLPSNPNSRAIYIRHINQCWNWGLKNELITKAHKIPGDTRGQSRTRTYTKDELGLMFRHIQDASFNAFVRFAYYTGARSGEIRNLNQNCILKDSIFVYGKTRKRHVKLNSQALLLLKSQKKLWNYRKDFVSHHFKLEIRKLGIRNGRFHDLRRTFGLNLIKQNMSIYKVSKLLGHASVRTTEQHYAPLLSVDVEDFIL